MLRSDFVDRVEDLTGLRDLVRSVGAGQGRAVVFEGASGMGKSTLLTHFVHQIGSDPHAPRCRVVETRCRPAIGHGLMYELIATVLQELDATRKQQGWLPRMLGAATRGAVRQAPDVLSALVPGLGAAFALGREVTQAALDSGSVPFDSLVPFQQGAVAQIVHAFRELVAAGPPVVVVIDDLQYIDPSSLRVLDRLMAGPAVPMGLVMSRALESSARHGDGGTVEKVIENWEHDGRLERRSLAGLPVDAIAELVRLRHPQAPSALSARLSEVTSGHPVFVTLCLDEWRPENGERIVLPDRIARVVDNRLRPLDEEDRRLIEIGAVQGTWFLSRTVAEVVGEPHDRVMERLRAITRWHHLISEEVPPDWAQRETSDCYRFQHRALWEVIYGQQSPGQRQSRHARIAAALTPDDLQEAPLDRRLQVAHHLRRGGPECLAASATAHYGLARSAATEGLSFAEAEQHCEEAIRAARALPVAADGRDRLLVAAIELLLSLTEVRWRGQHEQTGKPEDIDGLAAEAEAAAARCAVPELVARTTLLRGKTLLATRGLEPSLAKLHAAVEYAREHDDPVALFVARVEYGRQVSKRRLAEGLAQLREAERLYALEPRLGGSGDPVLQHTRNLGEMQLGVTLFDDGRLSEALTRLRRCADRLRGEALQAELPIALNYLAQVRLALGRYEEAEAVLREAREFEESRGGESGWHAYNTALLALALTHTPGRREESLALMAEAWAETEKTWLVNLVPIVRNLHADVVLATADGEPAALEQAHRLAEATCVETRQTGMVRSEIAAFVLRGRIRLLQGDVGEAVAHAREAVRLLDEVGAMPALRTEEVLYHGARALHAAGVRAEAQELLERARAEVRRKAENITDAALRRSFHENVPLNRALLSDRPFN